MVKAFLWLSKYGMHRPMCSVMTSESKCDCGYTDLMTMLWEQI